MMLDNFQLHGRIAIVTGCNKGLGQGMAIALAQAGADIVGINSQCAGPDRRDRGVVWAALSGPARQPGKHLGAGSAGGKVAGTDGQD